MLKKKITGKYKMLILIASVALMVAFSIRTTIAYIITTDTPVENTFVPAVVNCSVDEVFNGETKTDVSIKNTGNINAFIRVKLIITWQSEENASEIFARQPIENEDYLIEWGEQGWIKGSDGFWYYSKAVLPQSNTKKLINKIEPLGETPEGYRLSVEILASAIQAEPSNVVTEQWGVSNNSGIINPR